MTSPAFRTRVVSLLLLSLLAIVPTLLTHSIPAQAATSIKINFQNSRAAVPAGYLRDYGLPYGQRAATETGTSTAPGPSNLTYGWKVPGSNTPLDLSSPGNGRDRNYSPALDQRFDTLMHMQADDIESTFNGVKAEGYWEIALANGTYDVTVAVGDALIGNDPETHTLRVEGVTAVQGFVPTGPGGSSTRHRAATVRVTLRDGRLTVDAQGGTNTKIHYIDIASSDPSRPYVTSVAPVDGAGGVPRNVSITATVFVPNGGIRAETVNEATVTLVRTSDQSEVPATVNTTGGGDALTLVPSVFLEPNTSYTFRVTDGVRDAAGKAFIPFTSKFTTGTGGGPGSGSTQVAFEQVRDIAREPLLSSLAIGPDNKLYAVALDGNIYRYTIGANGALGGRQQITTVTAAEGGPRAIIGLAFDPAATASNLILWITHNGPYVPEGAADWTGKIARLSGPNLENFQNYVVNLPHSYKDHMVNSLKFGPDGAIYVNVGSNSAMGSPDDAWGQRPERLLSGALLRVDPGKITSPPLNVKTSEGGNYNPFAANAPVTFYATGIRNAYDMVWHSNGQLYVPANGSAAGGNTPATPANVGSLPACQNRVDKGANGAYTGPAAPSLTNVPSQRDYVFRIRPNGYYGHPNPLRCEWVLNGGNPTSGIDPTEIISYTVGVAPDRNYRGVAYDFGVNKSPNGAIEYKSNAFGGALKGKLLVARYSQGDDIVVLEPGGPNLDIVGAQEQLPGLFGLSNPLDITEDTRNGNLYVIEFGPPSQISLLRPVTSQAPRIQLSTDELALTGAVGSTTAAQQVQVQNVGSETLSVRGVEIAGANADQFQISGSAPTNIAGGNSATVQVAFRPTSPGPKSALLRLSSNAANAGVVEVVLRGLAVASGAEPSLQWILDTYEIRTSVGDDAPATAVINSDASRQKAALLGDEVRLQRFARADNANPVIIEPLAVFGPSGANPAVSFGWYPAGNLAARSELFKVGNSPAGNAQRLAPTLAPGAKLTFDPGQTSFGFYSIWPAFASRAIASEDALNRFSGAIPHHVRVYPLKDSTGAVVPNTYVVAMEEHIEGFDYQDVVFIVRNVRPAGTNFLYLPSLRR